MIKWLRQYIHSKLSGRVILVTAVRDEAPYLLEWLSHYRAIGVDRIDVYCNHCSDVTIPLLQEVSNQFAWLQVKVSDVRDGQRPQMLAQRDLLSREKWKYNDWVLHFDCDEFLVLHNAVSIGELLSGMDNKTGRVVFNWRVFGSSGHIKFLPERVTHRFTAACLNNNHRQSKVVKSAFRPLAIDSPGIHRPNLKPGWATCFPDGSAASFIDDGAVDASRTALAQLNHYIVRSRAEFCHKQARGAGGGKWSSDKGQPVTKGEYNWRFFERVDSLCDGYDNSIRCHDTAVNSILNELLEHTSIATLHAQALREAQDRTESLLESMEA